MNKKVLWITETAVLLALLIVLQWVTKPLGQIVTGSCVNAVLAVTALLVGLGGGLTVALVSPVCAYLLGIAPNLVAVPAIMVGNAVFVVALKLLCGKALWRQITADCLGMELVKTVSSDSSLGSAMLAGVAVGVFASAQEAVKKCIKTESVTTPIPENTRQYEAIFKEYIAVHDALAPIYQER